MAALSNFKKACGFALAFSLAVVISACAPEPNDGLPESPGSTEKPVPEQNVDKEIPGRGPTETPKETVVPADFPTSVLPVFEGLTVYDVGQRNSHEWFIVYELDSFEAGDSAMQQYIDEGDFLIDEEELDDGGKIWQLENADGYITSVSMNSDSKILLNLDLELRP